VALFIFANFRAAGTASIVLFPAQLKKVMQINLEGSTPFVDSNGIVFIQQTSYGLKKENRIVLILASIDALEMEWHLHYFMLKTKML
jgi:uncharacterized protein (AIM24 family)